MKQEIFKSEKVSETPAVSVVIPAYNAAGHIGEALDSVFAQTFTDYELIVVNDGSPDTEDLERVLGPYLERLVYIKQENRGPSGARNTAIRKAQGTYVAMLDSDDMWLPEFLAEQMTFLTANPEVDLVYTDAWIFGDTELAGRTFMQGAPSRGQISFESLLRYETQIITSCTVLRRAAAIDAGLFDEEFIRCEDFDLWIRLAHRGHRMSYQRKVLAKHRMHSSSLASQQVKMVEAQIEVLKKAQRTLALTQSQRELIDGQLQNCDAQINLELSKDYFVTRDYQKAAKSLRRANSFYNSRKLSLVIWGLSLAPRILHLLYVLRRNLGRSSLRRHATQK